MNQDQVLQELVLEGLVTFWSVPWTLWDSGGSSESCGAQKHSHVTSYSFSRTETSLLLSWGFLTPSAFGSPTSPSPTELSVPVEA